MFKKLLFWWLGKNNLLYWEVCTDKENYMLPVIEILKWDNCYRTILAMA